MQSNYSDKIRNESGIFTRRTHTILLKSRITIRNKKKESRENSTKKGPKCPSKRHIKPSSNSTKKWYWGIGTNSSKTSRPTWFYAISRHFSLYTNQTSKNDRKYKSYKNWRIHKDRRKSRKNISKKWWKIKYIRIMYVYYQIA